MEPIRISAPTAAAAFALVELLPGQQATATSDHDGRWEVVVPLRGSGRTLVPSTLSAIREWLEACGLSSTSVRLDGQPHLLKAEGPGMKGAMQ
ncbi:MAG TPA: hypothetical protein VM049_05305 [Gaiellaceae bacterium]|nr:hypothetical protein [Gaiellaceae bacterium]